MALWRMMAHSLTDSDSMAGAVVPCGGPRLLWAVPVPTVSVLEEITGKAAAVAVVVEGWYFSVQDTKVCNMLAAACRTELNAYSQAAGLGVGATTWMELGESRAAEEVSR